MKLRPVSYAIACAAVVLHLAFNHRFGYYRDELYFIDCARHLAWGYVDQPPLAPLVTWMAAPVGYALWALRLLPAILSGVTVLLACLIARELRGGGFAQGITGLAVALAPGFLGLGYALSTEFLSPAAWSAVIYLAIRLVKTKDDRLYLALAFVVTLAMYAKYSIAACALALALGLLITSHGKLLASRYLVLGAAAVIVLLLPNALWQLSHGLPMLGVLAGDRLNRHALANGVADESANLAINAAFFVATQFAYQNPFFSAIWIAGLVVLIRGKEESAYRFIPVAYFLLVALIVVTVGRGYYLEGFYPALFAAGSVATERFFLPRPRWWRPAVLGAVVAAGAAFAPLALPVLPFDAYLRYEIAIGLSRPMPPDGKHHLINPLYADQLGWKAMTQTVAHAYWSLPRERRQGTAIFADRYAYAGAIDFYGPRYGLPPVISPNNSYYLWGTRGYTGNSVLAVGATDYPLLMRSFGSVVQVAVYRNDYRWILEGPLPIYLCTRPRAPLALMWPAFKYYGL
ncbi:MAG: glycosyltransferase family 39 protein [Candidatus Tumulicola sp.]